MAGFDRKINNNCGYLPLMFIFTISCVAGCTGFGLNDDNDISDIEAVFTDTAALEITYAGTDESQNVTQGLILPSTGANGTTVTWTSSDESLIDISGAVVRPSYSAGDTPVTLTATVKKGSVSDIKIFPVRVLALAITTAEANAEAVANDKAALAITYASGDSAGNVNGDIILPTSGANGTTISWASNNYTISTSGNVTCRTTGDVSVTLTATISKGGVGDIKTFALTVKIKIYRPGDVGPAGGWVFYDKGSYSGSPSWRYLETAPSDQSQNAVWGTVGTLIRAGLTGYDTAIGKGNDNTNLIITRDPLSTTAADICGNYVLGIYSNWYLPSRDELFQMYAILKTNGIGGFIGEFYWCSSESDTNLAYGQYFSNGMIQAYSKGGGFRVRAIHSF